MIRFCEAHDVYYLPEESDKHVHCQTYPLPWNDVIYCLNKLKQLGAKAQGKVLINENRKV